MAVDKLVDSAQLDAALTATASAIRAKTGSAVSLPWNLSTGFQAAVEAIPTGGGAISKSDVNFYDYDGTIITSYTASDFAALTALPDNPSHTGLTAQGWNWTLADAKAYVSKYGKLNIGQMYITDDGKTRIYIHLEEGRLAPYLGIAVNGTSTVDWGDGSTDTITGSSVTTVINTQHVYASAGDYVISIDVGNGALGIVGTNDTSKLIWGNNPSQVAQNMIYRNTVQKVELGQNITAISNGAFHELHALSVVTIPNSVSAIDQYAFGGCKSLVSVTIPNGVTSIGNFAFQHCWSLHSVALPNSVLIIGDSSFASCVSIIDITLPDSGISIGTSLVNSCSSLKYIILPDSITSIGGSMAYNCGLLHSVNIPDGISSISSSSFYRCRLLFSVNIPDSVTSIGSSAFSGCTYVKEYHIKAAVPPTLSNKNTFEEMANDCIIYVPSGTLSAYQSANIWSNFASHMQEEPTS